MFAYCTRHTGSLGEVGRVLVVVVDVAFVAVRTNWEEKKSLTECCCVRRMMLASTTYY